MNMPMKKAVARICVALMVLSGLASATANASMIRPDATAGDHQLERRAENMQTAQAFLQRDEVREKFVEMGVSPADVEERLAGLTDDELQNLASDMEDAPAGGVLAELLIILLLFILIFHWHPHHSH